MFFNKHIRLNHVIKKIVIKILLFRSNKALNNNNRIGIIALHKLGDSIFTIPAIKQIINHHKKNIFLVCFSETTSIFKIIFSSINFIELSHNDFFLSNRIAKHKTRKGLKKLNFSTIYDLTGAINSATLLLNNPAKDIIGINETYYKPIYTRFSKIRSEPHMTDIYLDAIKSVIPFKNFERITIKNNGVNKYIIIHPFASIESKEWGLNKYICLTEHLNKRYNCVIVTPTNKISADVLSQIIKKKIKVVETKTTAELIETIKHCSLLIGNDSGPVHIANLLGKPTFTIYGPTNPLFHKPLEGRNKYIIKEIPCSPKLTEKMCFTCAGRIGCPSFECINKLSFKEVKDSVDEFIESLEKQNTKIVDRIE
jgi:ADP-heptose:LPS heptosyltransferase